MKKLICVFLVVVSLLTLSACSSSKDSQEDTTTQTVERVDVDLTQLSSTMVYSEVYNMLSNPDDYVGKTIKMAGAYNLYTNEDASKNYHAVVIEDATSCCQQGLEFVPADDNIALTAGEHIEVVGVFNKYNEGELIYIHLENAIVK